MKRKKQPSAEMMREQLRLSADEIIRLRTAWMNAYSPPSKLPWWRRMFRKSA